MRFNRKTRVQAQVPTSSMADIAFLLLVFFMVTTVLKLEEGLPIDFPKAEAVQAIPREQVIHIWVSRAGDMVINDALVTLQDIEPIVTGRLIENPGLIVAFNVDEHTPYIVVADVMEELKRANATRASFTSKKERPREG